MTDFALIRHYYNIEPGDLTYKQFFGYLDRINDILEIIHGVDHRARVERLARRAKED